MIDNSLNKKRRRAALWLLPLLPLSLLAQAIAYFVRAINQDKWPIKHDMVYVLASILVWGAITISLVDIKTPVWHVFLASWAFGTLSEVVILGLMFSSAPQDDNFSLGKSFGSARTILLMTLLISDFIIRCKSGRQETHSDEESRSLLASEDNVPGNTASYDSLPSSIATEHEDESGKDGNSDDEDDEVKELQQKRLKEQGGWWGYLKGFMVFLPYIWPYNNRRMQLWLSVLLFSIIVERFLTVLIPRQLGIITDALSDSRETGYFPWKELFVWAMLKLISISAGFELLRSMANSRIGVYAFRQLSSAAFNHVMSLSMDYHCSKSCGDVIKAIEQGSDIHDILDTVLFEAAPMLIDLVVAAVWLSSVFDAYMALIIIATSAVYIYAGVRANTFIVHRRREYTEGERKGNEILYDAVSNWQTVAYHNRGPFERARYAAIVDGYTAKQVRYWDASDVSEALQSLIMALGLLASAFLAAARIAAGTAPVGHLVLLVTYWATIHEPLKYLAWTFRHTSSQLISAERLLQLLQTPPSVADAPGARPLRVTAGRVTFTDVSFAYDARKPTLRNISLTAEPGQTIALVGETGGGKSTLLKLLLRFYDATSGAVAIDGQDVRAVTLDSLRAALGAVPQDPALLNQSVTDNVRYARPDATDADVRAACRAAAVHDQIVSALPDGYASRVGERGVRLSGGELQRLAVARVLLKDPRVVLLDEATSAVDSATEERIQEAFARLSEGRTVFVVAHRLSTVVRADLILVVDDGAVVERGTHAELLGKRGKYYELWSKQAGV
ncbi:hypothetical protein SLS58_006702 [Diplodia intermedia]|uniref:Abc transporter n=1 Tax=Diplodia intermedia TaxID=856260 RepID=A0ABR3TMB2_9PEZI